MPILRQALLAKLHFARVTRCDREYMGSISIDADLLDAVGLRPNEKVLVCDVENGSRFETYVLKAARGSREIGVNGAAALLTGLGHRVLIMSFGLMSAEEMASHRPKVAICDAANAVSQVLAYDPD
jgi:aspartate 1-decarboxylase